MKKLFTFFLALGISAGTMFADPVQIGDLYYYLYADTDDKTAMVTSSGEDYCAGDIIIPASVTYNDDTYSVTSIGDYAFAECTGLTSVTIPNGVTSIGDNAFYQCTGLTSVTIGNSVTSIGNKVFYGCTGLTSIIWNAKNCKDFSYDNAPFYKYNNSYDIRGQITSVVFGDEVEHIPAYLCCEMSQLTNISIPNSVTSIGDYAFAECTGLTSVTIGNSVTSIGENAFYDCTGLPVESNLRYADTYLVKAVDNKLSTYTIKEETKWIGDGAFKYCTDLTSITIPSSVTSIGKEAFGDCTSLTSVIWNAKNCADFHDPFYNARTQITSFVFGDEVEHIPTRLCGGTQITNVTIPNSVTSIGDYAFESCDSLTSVTIGNNVTSIGKETFAYCAGLTSITIPNSVTSIGESAFLSCTGLTSVTIPNSVTSIGDWAFRDCTGLTSIIWNAKNCADFSLNLNAAPFYGLSHITSFVFGNEVEYIPAGLCYKMTQLTTITIPNSVTSIGTGAFSYCTGLTSITCLATNPPSLTLYGNVFYNVNKSIPLYVPVGSINAYKVEEQWKEFTNILPISSAEEIETSEVTATPTEEDGKVILEWPAVENADTYTITIAKNGEVVCTLVFDAEGRLISIAFAAPARDGKGRNVPAAEQSAKGWRYTVEGLDAGAEYTYTITAKKEDESVLFTQSINFTMPAPQGIDDINAATKSQKIVRDNQVLILRGEKTYTVTGQEVK